MLQRSDTPLAMTTEEREALGRAALDWCLQYFDAIERLRVYPTTSADALRAIVEEPVPDGPSDVSAVMAQFAQLAEHARHNGHPRMFGYVQSSGTFAGVVADLLVSALNQNVTSWRSAPSATTVERQVIDWIGRMIDFPAEAGLFVSGGSLANFAALATALTSCSDVQIAEQGVAALGREPRIYASTMVHMSIAKAAGLLGLGRARAHSVPVNDMFEMDAHALEERLAADRAAGRLPVCVVGTAGDVNTGAIDPLDQIAEVCARHDVWFHVDASYGGFAALAPSVRDRFRGLARADSVALDPHKWLYAPLDAGCLLVRDRAALYRAFSHGAAYVDVVADRDMSEFAFWDYGPELSRRFRALKIWFALKLHGARAIAEAIESNVRVARHLAELVDASDDFERLAPCPLSIVCFRYLPPGLGLRVQRGEAAAIDELNAFNRQLMVEVQRDGDSYLSNALINGAFALRACIVNFRTTTQDVEGLLATIRRVADRLWYAR